MRKYKVLIHVRILFFQPAEVSNTELSKQREIEKETEDLMDEGDFLEYKVSRNIATFWPLRILYTLVITWVVASVIFVFGEEAFLLRTARACEFSRALHRDSLWRQPVVFTFTETTAASFVNSCASSFWDLWQQDFFRNYSPKYLPFICVKSKNKETKAYLCCRWVICQLQIYLHFFVFVFLQNLIGEWTPDEGAEIQGPAKDNAVLGHIIHRLFNIVSPPEVL